MTNNQIALLCGIALSTLALGTCGGMLYQDLEYQREAYEELQRQVQDEAEQGTFPSDNAVDAAAPEPAPAPKKPEPKPISDKEFLIGAWVGGDSCATEYDHKFERINSNGVGAWYAFYEEGNWYIEGNTIYISVEREMDEQTGDFVDMKPLGSYEYTFERIDAKHMLITYEDGTSTKLMRC